MPKRTARISGEPIDLEQVLREVKDDSAGGTVVFIGSVRYKSEHGRVTELEYQTYKEMAEKGLRKIEAETRRKWPVKQVVMVHREGPLKVGEISVVVAVSSEHRAEAFAACRYAIDRIKSALPIWKKEKLGGTGRWVEGTPIQGPSFSD